jgi:hypothetical protein
MGLDQYAKVRNPETGEVTEIYYWRKHNALHGWMEQRYRDKNPEFEGDFNCVPFELLEEDLDALEEAVTKQELPETVGFFFGGDTRFHEEARENDLEFIKLARNAIAEGMQVAYDSWW